MKKMRNQMNFDGMNYLNNSYNCSNYGELNNNSIRCDNNRNMNMNFDINDPMQLVNMMNNNSSNLDLAKPNEAFIRGNLYNNLYQGYKNYRPMRLVPNNPQAALLLELDTYCFAAHELRLYLDVHPNDKSLIDLFNQYNARSNELLMEYEQKYGPITWNSLSNPNEFSWSTNKWPWDMEVI